MRVPSLSTAKFAVLVALVLALFASGIVVGAAGAPLILGEANGASGQLTTLTSNRDSGAVLKVVNPGDARALELQATSAIPLKILGATNKPPMAVNSTSRVSKLNADFVDGWSANDLIRVAYANDDFVVDGAAATNGRVTTTIEAPARGWITISGSGWVFNASGTTPDAIECAIEVNDVQVTGSRRAIDVDSDGAGDAVVCGTNVGYRVCSAGTYVIDLEFSSLASLTDVNDGSVVAQYSPFNGSGAQPSLLSCLPFSPASPDGGAENSPKE